MPSHPVELGPFTFRTKTEAKDYISREILHGYSLGEPINKPDHIAVLEDVLRRKENAEEKVGSGIDFFYVDKTSRFRDYVRPDALTIVVHRKSDTEADVDFGYSRIIDDSSDVDYAKEALRYAIADKRDAFKFAQFDNGNQPPDENGVPLASHDESEVRYTNPDWGTLTANFASSVGGWSEIDTHSGNGVGGQIGRRLISSEVEKRWQDFYDRHAKPVLTRKR